MLHRAKTNSGNYYQLLLRAIDCNCSVTRWKGSLVGREGPGIDKVVVTLVASALVVAES